MKRDLKHCERCGWDWFPVKAEPTMCPRCKSLLWKVPKPAEERRAG